MNVVNWINVFFGDLRYSLRQFRRNPMFTTIAILSLGLGIGANTAIFSLMNAMLFRNLPVRDPHKLVMLTSPDDSGWFNGFAENERGHISYPEFLQLREQLTTLSGLCAADSALQDWQVRIGGQQQEKVFGKFVSEEYFSVFGVEAAMGRLLDSQDARGPGQDPYAVISYDFWQRRFGGQTDVLGMPITLNSATLTVIGVARQGFKGESVAQNPDLWIPMMMQPSVYVGRDWLHEDPSQSLQKVMWLNAFGRLKPEAGLGNVQGEVNVVFPRMMEAFYPSTLAPDMRDRAFSQYLVVRDASAGTFPGRDDIASQLKILLAVTGLVLLIACANVANLLLGRATGRQREMSVRFALGASRLRIFQQLFTESLLLSLLGGVAGLLIALSASRILLSLISDPHQPFDVPGAPDWRVLGFTAGVALVTSALFGLAPARRASRTDINISLRESSRAVTYSGRKMNLAKIMVVGQVAVSFLLIVGAGLLVRTLWNLQAISLGYPKERLLQVKVDGLSAGYKDQALVNFYGSMADRLSEVPGVRGVAYSDLGLLTGSESRCRIQIDGVTPEREEDRRSNYDFISPGYFDVLEVPLLMGREVLLQDTAASQKVCVINEELAGRLGGQYPIGRRLTALSGKISNTMEIVGVVKNVRSGSLRNRIPPRFYAPVRQGYFDQDMGPVVFQIRTVSDPTPVLSTVRKAVFDANPNVPVTFSSTIENLIADRTLNETQIARLCSIFGLIALQLAAVGLYGVISQGIARRTNEIGIRMALGATPGKIIRMVLGETGFLAAIGLAAGVLAAGMATRVIASKLFGLGRMDPLTITVALAVVSAVALVAGYIPAARAARVNPVEALRRE